MQDTRKMQCAHKVCALESSSYLNMTQIASVLSAATVFISLWTLISWQRRGAYMRDKIPMQELEPKVQWGLIRGGGG